MKTFSRYISQGDDLADLIEGVTPFVTRAASVGTVLKLRNQLSKMQTPDGKAIAGALMTLANLIALSQFTTTED